MQIEIDFEVFKALTALRANESDSYNHVLRRVLELPPPPPAYEELAKALSEVASGRARQNKSSGLFGLSLAGGAGKSTGGLIAAALGGVWYNGVHLPEGTLLKATYKGALHTASIKDGRWIGSDGVVRSSPSDAASAISNTNVNGWRFWQALLPDADEWVRLDELKS